MKMIFRSKTRRYVARVSIFLICMVLIAGMVGCNYIPPSKNLEIRTWYDLDAVRDNLAGNHILMNNLNSSTPGYEELAGPIANGGRGWQPIGTEDDPFAGNFDGRGYEIRDLCINRTDEWRFGLFFGIGEGGVIKDLGVIGNITSIGSCAEVGGLAAFSSGTVSNCYATGSMTGLCYVGGLVGWNWGTISNSYFNGSVTGDACVGGLVGWNSGTIGNSYFEGSVTGTYDIGGLVGRNDGAVSDSYSTGNVTGADGVGGLVGSNFGGSVSNSYSSGNVTGEDGVGGLLGLNRGTVSNSYFNYDEALINGQSIITVGALFGEDFDEWLTNDKFLDVNDRLSQEDGYYLINDIGDFKQLLAFGQNGTLKFRLSNDLDLADEPNFYIPYLAGELDGSGHKISNLSFKFDFVLQVGLFGRLASGGNVANTGVENVNITAAGFAGGLVGENCGTVDNSYSTGSVTGRSSVGGLVGYISNGNVSNSYSTGNFTGTYFVGGLVGRNNEGAIGNSYSTGNVTGTANVGGLVGNNMEGAIGNSYFNGSVTGTYEVGGLVGWHSGTIDNSHSNGSVAGYDSVGGLVGWAMVGTVSNCYAAGNASGSLNTGGLIGYNRDSTVMNSFWDVQTSGQPTSAGGTGKNTTEMQSIATFSGAGWNIIAVALNETNPAYIWNIIDNVTYPFLSWQS